MTISANQNGGGTDSFTQAAAGSTITSTNTTTTAVQIKAGGLGNVSIRSITASGGGVSVITTGGSVLYSGSDPLTGFFGARN